MVGEHHLATLLDWADGILQSTDPDDPESYFNDHARECAESIAFSNDRPTIRAAIDALRHTQEGIEP